VVTDFVTIGPGIDDVDFGAYNYGSGRVGNRADDGTRGLGEGAKGGRERKQNDS